MEIYKAVTSLVRYGRETGLVKEEDEIYVTNRILEVLGLDDYEPAVITEQPELEEVLKCMTDYAVERKLVKEDSVVYRDLFDTKVMGALVPFPSTVTEEFRRQYAMGPRFATDYFYKLSQDSDYIRRYRIKKDQKWLTKTEYGELEITINLSKPEKDPKAIAAARNAASASYPKCQLCRENEGYAGRVNHPARQNHRIIPVTIGGKDWGFQYSPYVYYNEHCIVFNGEHVPMKIERETFVKLLDFVSQFPHYFVGSNADLPIVGGSILSHDHFQGGNHEFAMAKAPVVRTFTIPGHESVEAGIVKWPMSVIRLRCHDTEALVDAASHVLDVWKTYTDETAFIFAETDGERHNTITPIARMKNGMYELDLVLRNNITTEEHPLGVFHPHARLHHIKKENIGLIEVMGLAVLPARLKSEMEHLAEAILEKKDLRAEADLEKHADWAEEFLPKYPEISPDNIMDILHEEIGQVFRQVLEDAGVYKQTEEGQKAFVRFVSEL
ncbi:UDP-glucose--hexose-1-phosphate uridylyltransferase [Candidatus Bariatricus faecipullorum]